MDQDAQGLGSIVSRELKRAARPVADFSSGAFDSFYKLALSLYVIPTDTRETPFNKSGFQRRLNPSNARKAGERAGTVAGVAADLATAGFYLTWAFGNGESLPFPSEMLALPVLTNVASGIYEFGRSKYREHRDLDKPTFY